MRYLTTFFLIAISNLAIAQTGDLNEQFNDGDFTSSPAWSGNTSEFIIFDDAGNNVLRLNDTDASSTNMQLRTVSTAAYGGWEFYVELDFGPSGSNYTDVYLISDQADLQNNLNGYFVRIGDTEDEISLYRQDGSSTTKIIDGPDGSVDSDPVAIRVKVTRDNSGNWDISFRNEEDAGFTSQGTVLDNTYTSSSYFGFVPQYTSTRSENFYFDDIFINVLRAEEATPYANQVVDVTFNYPLDAGSISPSDFSLSGGIGSPQQVQLVNDDYTARLDYGQTIPNDEYTLTINNVDDIFGNTIASGTEIDFTFANPFELLSITSPQDDQALLTFSENVALGTVTTGDFTINGDPVDGGTNITQPQPDQILLDLTTSLPSGSVEIEVTGIESSTGWNIPSGSSGSFFIFDAYQSGDIVINEFMKDPPTGTEEYVELYNTSSRYLNLKDWQIGDNNSETTISNDDLAISPNDYVVISSDTATLYSYYGDAHYIEVSLPALNNGSDDVRLLDENSTTIESLSYDSDWGGVDVAIERRDPSVSATYLENWGDSPAAEFGTPGQANQVSTDETAPSISELVIEDDQTLLLVASERLESTSATNTGNYSLTQNPESGASTPPLPSITTATQVTGDTIRLALDTQLEEYDGDWTLQADNLTDVFGNTTNGSINFNFFVIFTAEENQVAINEFMYDPAPDFSEFVELYNHSDSSFDLQDWTLNDNSGDQETITFSNITLPRGEYAIIAPDSSLADLFPDARLIVMGNRFPALNNSTDAIAIRNQNGLLIDSLSYSSDWGGNEVSLERRSPDYPASFAENWGDSPSEDFATPGTVNEIALDNTPPELVGFEQVSGNEVQLIFSERIQQASAETITNFTLSADNINDIPTLQSATFSAPDTILLSYSTDFPHLTEGTTYQLSVSNQADIFDNTTSEFTTSFFVIEYAIADSADAFITEFLYSPQEGFSDFIELYNATEMPFNLQGWTYNDDAGNPRSISDTAFTLQPDSRIVLTPDSTLMDRFPNMPFLAMGSRFANLNSTTADNIVIRNAQGTLIDSLTYNSDWGGSETSLERRSNDLPATFKENWGNSPSENTATPGDANEILPDETPPALTDVQAISNTELRVLFSESVQPNPASTLSNFSLEVPSGEVNSPALQSIDIIATDTLILSFDATFPRDPDGTTYELSITNQTDIFGNEAGTLTDQFFLIDYAEADSGEVFVTEFLYSRSDVFSEFIEFYNASDSAFNLRNWTYNDNSRNPRVISETDLPLNPGEYFIITPDSVIFENFPSVNFVAIGSRFSALNNGEDDIVIRDQNGALIDSISYTSDWGGSETSLERRSTDFPAFFKENWGNSPAESGATPGLENQIPEDETPPAINSFTAVNDSTVQVIYSERVQTGPATELGNYELAIPTNTGLSYPDLERIDFLQPDTVLLHYEFELPRDENGTTLNFMISNQTDIFGNVANPIQEDLFIIDLSESQPGDVVINEFMYDPEGAISEFVELYNHSDKNFDLAGWLLNDNTGNRRAITDTNYDLATGAYVLLAPDSSLVQQFPNREIIVMGSRFSSLNNSTDAIVISNADSVIIDSLTYSSEWGGNNVSLERLSPTAPSVYQENWANSPASQGATPAQPNQVQPDEAPPEIVSATHISADSIRITFNERVDATFAQDLNSYSISPSVGITEIAGYSGNELFLVLNSALTDGTTYTVSISNQQDIFGNVMASDEASFEYILLSEAQPRDLIVNEILYRRATANSEEFIELFNRTDQNFDLSGWTLSDATGSTEIPAGTQIRGNSYLVFTDVDPNESQPTLQAKRIKNKLTDAIYLSGFPSLNDDEDAVVIKNENGLVIDSLFYNETWGGNQPGKSLERKDPESASNDASNWATSTAESGNSAGGQSATFQPDETAPEVIFSKFNEEGKVLVAFSEFVNIDLNEPVFVNEVAQVITGYDETEGNIVIIGEDAFSSGEPLTVVFNYVEDFRGNASEDLTVEVSQPLTPGDIVINEILYNPLANPDDNLPDQTEYIELYNRSEYAVSLEGFYLHDEPDENNEVRTITPVDSRFKWIPSNEYVIVYAEDQTNTFSESRLANYFELSEADPFPFIWIDRSSLSIANNDDAIYLADSTGATIDSVFYDESWQNPNLYDTDGVALERIDPNGPSDDASNWSSSTRVNGGSPGEQNSIFQESGAGPEDTGISFSPNPFSPDDDGFDDNLFINYKLDESDYLLRVRIFDRYGREVRELADGKQAGFEGSLIWDGLTDDNRKNRVGIYIVLFEAYNSANGKNKTFKETVVLARKF